MDDDMGDEQGPSSYLNTSESVGEPGEVGVFSTIWTGGEEASVKGTGRQFGRLLSYLAIWGKRNR